ncbi:MAG TPA: hypothetical protein VHY09_00600 [Candidatus Methylacidiphilales bacterium]|jgi:hypothetical protein|nr:hypothetical protein [Candidatus Methylacidiphilales bacterium]
MTIPELQKAIQELPEKEQWKFKEWLDEFMADQWDLEIERDVAAGRFDRINAKIEEDIKAGRCSPLRGGTDPSTSSG